MISNTEIELYGRVCELEGISFIECNKDILDLLKITYSKVSDVREFSKNNLIKIENVFFIGCFHVFDPKSINRYFHQFLEALNLFRYQKIYA